MEHVYEVQGPELDVSLIVRRRTDGMLVFRVAKTLRGRRDTRTTLVNDDGPSVLFEGQKASADLTDAINIWLFETCHIQLELPFVFDS